MAQSNKLDEDPKDPYNYLYKHISKIEEEINSESERIKQQLNKAASDLLEQVNDYENECKLDLNTLLESINEIQKDLIKLKVELVQKESSASIQVNLKDNIDKMKVIGEKLLTKKVCHLTIKGFDLKSSLFANENKSGFKFESKQGENATDDESPPF